MTTPAKSPAEKRKVRIEQIGDTWAVLYRERKKGQRHMAACFHARDHDFEYVRQWVIRNPKLELL